MRTATARAVVLAALAVGSAACTAVKSDEGDTAATAGPGAPSSTTPASVTGTTVPPIDLEAVEVTLVEVAEVDQPTALAARAGDYAVYITQRPGEVRRIQINTRQNGAQTFTLERTPVLDISNRVLDDGQEQGLLGLAFSTDGNRLYVAYTGADANQHLDEYRMNGTRVDASTRRELLVVPDFAENHNGGNLAFGPDGFLYWSMGDGGGGGDPQGSGQDPHDLLGSLLRIDPDVPRDSVFPYAVPDGNPFRDGADGAPEVWAYGLRNPWRFSFDRATGDLWIADVGQGDVEEIDFLPGSVSDPAGRAANMGWSLREGDRPFNGGEPPAGAVEPIFAYDHSAGGCAVTGGYVYRGTKIPALVGAYLWGDFCLGNVNALVQQGGALVAQRDLGIQVPQLSSFGQDGDGELWVLSLEGEVFRLAPG
jgi:glucose/arabinose dehydrogenase